jgi:hypothetical protein
MILIEYAAGAAAAVVDGKTIDLKITYRAIKELSPSYEVVWLRGVLSTRQLMKLQRYLQKHERTFRPQDFGLMNVGDYNYKILLVEALPANPGGLPTHSLRDFYRQSMRVEPKSNYVKRADLSSLILTWKERKEGIESDLKRENLILATNERIRYEQAGITCASLPHFR